MKIQKKHLLLCFCLLTFTTYYAQVKKQKKQHDSIQVNENNLDHYREHGMVRCISTEIEEARRKANPKLGTKEEFESWMSSKLEQLPSNRSSRVSYEIPVVFHIMTDGSGADNISYDLVESQLDQMNLDFANLSGSPFSVAADIEIQFCMAVLDPNDAVMPEPGVNRITTYGDGPFSDANFENTLKAATQWDPELYLNIWVADITGNILGYAQFPDLSGLSGLNTFYGSPSTDGVVVLTSSVGSLANPNPLGGVYAAGRTLTHEVGHWLGLRHIWGDGGCGVDDFCADTPLSGDDNGGCPTITSCGSVDMVENYMDYTYDTCMNTFTQDQKSRMQVVMANSPRRNSLSSSYKCNFLTPTIAIDNGGIQTITEDTGCSFTEFSVDMSISQAVSSDVDVSFVLSGSATYGVDYTIEPAFFTIPSGSTIVRDITLRIFEDGIIESDESIIVEYTLSSAESVVIGTGSQGRLELLVQDDDNNDVSLAAQNQVVLNATFETGADNFQVQGEPGSDLYSLGNNATLTSDFWTTDGTNTSSFVYTNDDACDCDKSEDNLFSPTFDLVGAFQSATLTFDHAFANAPNETANVYLFDQSQSVLLGALSNTYAPDGNGQVNTPWVNGVTLDLSPFIGQQDLQVVFEYSDGGEWTYGMAIDNVTITVGTNIGIQEDTNIANAEQIDVNDNNAVTFFDTVSGNIMLTINNQSVWDYECTIVEVDNSRNSAGTDTVPFYDPNPSNDIASKTFYIDPNSDTASGSYSIDLFYTEDEITGWEFDTGNNRNQISIFRLNDARIQDVDASNFFNYEIMYETATIVPAVGGYKVSAAFSGEMKGTYGIGLQVNVLSNVAQELDVTTTVFPNPSEGVFTVQTSKNWEAISIYSMDGKLVRKEEGTIATEVTLDYSDLAKGIYILRLDGAQHSKAIPLIIN